MMRSALLSGAALALLGVGHAVAADMPVKAPPIVVPYFSWTGFYVGANAGYGWLDSNSTASGSPGVFDPILVAGGSAALASGLALATPSVPPAPAGFIGGGQIGFNRQIGWFVGGIEADIDGAAMRQTTVGSTLVGVPGFPGSSINAAAAASNRLDYLATVRGRLGYALYQQWLLYVTGGLAIGGVRSNIVGTDLLLGGAVGLTTTMPTAATSSDTRVGWTIGGGAEYALSAHWSAKVEALYYDLGRTNLNTTPASIETNPGGAGIGSIFGSANRVFSTQWTGGLARFGVNYRFN